MDEIGQERERIINHAVRNLPVIATEQERADLQALLRWKEFRLKLDSSEAAAAEAIALLGWLRASSKTY